MKYFTSDWHLGHFNVLTFSQRPFSTTDEMDNTLINNTLATLQPGDSLYFLGDLSFSKKSIEYFFSVWPKNIEFHWILGNHDKKMNPSSYKKQCASLSDLKKVSIDSNSAVLCHYPMLTWDRSHYNAWMLYGHMHNHGHGTDELSNRAMGKMFNVNCEFNNYKPYSEKDIIEIMAARPDNWDLIK